MWNKAKYLLPALLGVILIEETIGVQYCPPFWTQFHLPTGVFCYRFFGQKQTWLEAEKTCASFTACEGRELAHLVSISSFNEEVFITEYRQFMLGLFGLGEPGMWIGYNDRETEDDWKWTDPYIQSDFTNWAPRSPKTKNAKNKFDCTYQLVTNTGRSKWKDKDCREQHAFMCKMGAL